MHTSNIITHLLTVCFFTVPSTLLPWMQRSETGTEWVKMQEARHMLCCV